jgi:hypothetical protein
MGDDKPPQRQPSQEPQSSQLRDATPPQRQPSEERDNGLERMIEQAEQSFSPEPELPIATTRQERQAARRLAAAAPGRSMGVEIENPFTTPGRVSF